MSKDTYYPQIFKCSHKTCGQTKREYIWSSEIETKSQICDCGHEMYPFFEDRGEGPMIMNGSNKMTKEQIKADRRKRARSHFKKEVLPYLDRDSKNDHLRKMKRSGENWSK